MTGARWHLFHRRRVMNTSSRLLPPPGTRLHRARVTATVTTTTLGRLWTAAMVVTMTMARRRQAKPQLANLMTRRSQLLRRRPLVRLPRHHLRRHQWGQPAPRRCRRPAPPPAAIAPRAFLAPAAATTLGPVLVLVRVLVLVLAQAKPKAGRPRGRDSRRRRDEPQSPLGRALARLWLEPAEVQCGWASSTSRTATPSQTGSL